MQLSLTTDFVGDSKIGYDDTRVYHDSMLKCITLQQVLSVWYISVTGDIRQRSTYFTGVEVCKVCVGPGAISHHGVISTTFTLERERTSRRCYRSRWSRFVLLLFRCKQTSRRWLRALRGCRWLRAPRRSWRLRATRGTGFGLLLTRRRGGRRRTRRSLLGAFCHNEGTGTKRIFHLSTDTSGKFIFVEKVVKNSELIYKRKSFSNKYALHNNWWYWKVNKINIVKSLTAERRTYIDWWFYVRDRAATTAKWIVLGCQHTNLNISVLNLSTVTQNNQFWKTNIN